jgi:hypothetical protein
MKALAQILVSLLLVNSALGRKRPWQQISVPAAAK